MQGGGGVDVEDMMMHIAKRKQELAGETGYENDNATDGGESVGGNGKKAFGLTEIEDGAWGGGGGGGRGQGGGGGGGVKRVN